MAFPADCQEPLSFGILRLDELTSAPPGLWDRWSELANLLIESPRYDCF